MSEPNWLRWHKDTMLTCDCIMRTRHIFMHSDPRLLSLMRSPIVLAATAVIHEFHECHD